MLIWFPFADFLGWFVPTRNVPEWDLRTSIPSASCSSERLAPTPPPSRTPPIEVSAPEDMSKDIQERKASPCIPELDREHNGPVDDPANPLGPAWSGSAPTRSSRLKVINSVPSTPKRPQITVRLSSASTRKTLRTNPDEAITPFSGIILNLPPDLQVSVKKRCSGVSPENERCTTMVPLKEEEVRRQLGCKESIDLFYCGKHKSQAELERISIERGYEKWIPSYFQPADRIKFLEEFTKLHVHADRDGPGYLYLIQATGPGENSLIIKIGSTEKLPEARYQEWQDTKCPLLRIQPKLRYPMRQASLSPDGEEVRPVRLVRRAEHLVHIEAQILLRHQASLAREQPNFNINVGASSESIAGLECPGCNETTHREMYKIRRVDGVGEWEAVFLPIIEKWIAFVNTFNSEG